MQVRFIGSYTSRSLPPPRLPEIAVGGRSNVGKSSFINSMTGRRGIARVSSTPGRTRTLNFFQCDDAFVLVDLPGYGYSKAPRGEQERWARDIEVYLSGRETLRGIILVGDIRHFPTPSDLAALEWLGGLSGPLLVVLTKADKLGRGAAARHRCRIPGVLGKDRRGTEGSPELDGKSGERLKLFTPGPVELSRAARTALAGDVVHHRSESFRQALSELETLLKQVFITENPVATLTSSGTGAMEAAVVNLFSPGDSVMVPVAGKFSGRWAEICEAFGIGVRRMDLAPGESPEADQVVDGLKKDDRVKGVLLTHCETSTGSLTDVGAISKAIANHGDRIGKRFTTCVDCITSLCIDEFRMDEWRVDCAIGASQKGFLSPPGLAFVALDPERLEPKPACAYYFDLKRYFGCAAGTPFTPAVSLVFAVRESLESIAGLGLPAVWRAARASAAAIRLIIEAAGFRPVARHQACAVVAFWVGDLDADMLADMLEKRHGIVVARGQRELRGGVLRVSPVGKGPTEIRDFARALAGSLSDMGQSFRLDAIQAELESTMEDSSLWESLR
jgi:ribosome biogenesis GTP-binding protein YsxC/EngB